MTKLPQANPGSSPLGARPKARWLLAGGLLAALSALAACSENQPRRADSELVVDPPAAAPPAAPAPAAQEPPGPLPNGGRRYQVIVGTAYFFDQPAQSPPNGRYLRRGDTFYGEGETNGFVRTGFVQPNGAAGTAWLKLQELRPLPTAAAPAAPARRRPAAAPAAPLPAAVAAPAATRAVVTADRAYFYQSPALDAPRRAHCVRGDKVRLGEARGAAVFVTFTNWENVTTTGWMRQDALRLLR